MVRRAAFRGRFYPGDPAQLHQELDRCLGTAPPEPLIRNPIACIAPHAALMYSGPIAGAVYARMDLPDRFIILCPNHTGRGTLLSIMSEGRWQTPLGDAVIDAELSARLKRRCALLSEDAQAHVAEHSLEVQLPFLQKLRPQFTFVPIAVWTWAYDALEGLGKAMAEAIRESPGRVLIIASSDMNHYESDERTRQKDRLAIDQVLALDPRGLYDTVRHKDISMCGCGPAVAALVAARHLGAKNAELVRYGTSGEVSGDYDQVVGYAGIVIW